MRSLVTVKGDVAVAAVGGGGGGGAAGDWMGEMLL